MPQIQISPDTKRSLDSDDDSLFSDSDEVRLNLVLEGSKLGSLNRVCIISCSTQTLFEALGKMAESNHIGYEELLKPTYDHLLKNWSLALSLFLDDFMTHVEEKNEMNFSEAAMLLQHSSTFYCKRVDVVYKIMQELVTRICSVKTSEGEDESKKSGPTTKKKKAIKSLEMDDLEILNFVASDHIIDLKIEKMDAQWVPKQIVLCSSVKALRKSGTSVTVYQVNGDFLACKEEFRIFATTYSDGTVNDDYSNVDDEKLISRTDECKETEDFDDHAMDVDGFHDDVREATNDLFPDNELGEGLPPDNPTEISTKVPELSAAPASLSLPMLSKEYAAPSKPKIRKKFNWEPIPHDYKFHAKPIKIDYCYSIPKEILEAGCLPYEQIANISAKRKRREKRKQDDTALNDVKIIWIDQAIKRGSIYVYERRLEEETKQRRIFSNTHPRVDDFMEPGDAMGLVDDHDPNDFEDLIDDIETCNAAALTRADVVIPESDDNSYSDCAGHVIERFKEKRKENANRATEMALRVAEWHETMAPILERAELRSKFDVHEYGTRILDYFPDDDFTTFTPFKDVVAVRPKKEIGRYFLSSLMLINTYNLDFRRAVPGPMVKDCMELRLMTKVRHHEEMDEALRVTAEDCGT